MVDRHPRQTTAFSGLALRDCPDVVDDCPVGCQLGRDLSRQCPLVLTGDRAPKQDLTAAHDNADLRGVDPTLTMHLLLDPIAHLDIRRRNLAHFWPRSGRVHAAVDCKPRAFVCTKIVARAAAWGAKSRDLAHGPAPSASGTRVAKKSGTMDHALSRLLTASAFAVIAGVSSVTACTHVADRVVEPIGGADASTTTPEVGDGGISPIGPIAHPVEPNEDFRLVRAPEFGIARETRLVRLSAERRAGSGGVSAGGGTGFSGSNARPVASGGSYY